MKKCLLLVLGFLFFTHVQAQQESITTLILVRHAEKDFAEDGDPVLTDKGLERAQRLAETLQDVAIDSVYSTPFKRTRLTVEPVAQQRSLAVINYNPFKPEDVVALAEANKGKTLLLAGHSNTIPLILNMLIGEDKYRQLDESDYDNLYIVSFLAKGEAGVLQLQYGEVVKPE